MCVGTCRGSYNYDHNEDTELFYITPTTASWSGFLNYTSSGIVWGVHYLTSLNPSTMQENYGCGLHLESITVVGQDACDLYSFIVMGPISWRMQFTRAFVFQRLKWTEFFQLLFSVTLESYLKILVPHCLFWNTNATLFRWNFLCESSSSWVFLHTPSPHQTSISMYCLTSHIASTSYLYSTYAIKESTTCL